MNYGETLAYWYLRLNGFFLLNNFVVHRTPGNQYSSDIDLLGIRLPHVYEEVGGQPNDWHDLLMANLNQNIMTGVICEVKTGNFNDNEIFRPQYLHYALDRFGFIPNLSNHTEEISNNRVTTFENFQIIKILVSNQVSNRNDLLQITLQESRNFINNRIQKYQVQKWQDRILFQSDLLGDYIDQIHHE